MFISKISLSLGYDKDDDDASDHYNDYQTRARQLLIDTTRKNLEQNLKIAELAKRDVFIVSNKVLYSLVTAKGNRKTPLLLMKPVSFRSS